LSFSAASPYTPKAPRPDELDTTAAQGSAVGIGGRGDAPDTDHPERPRSLNIPDRPLVRRQREGTLSPEEPAKLVHYVRAMERAEAVFEDTIATPSWIQDLNAALGGMTTP